MYDIYDIYESTSPRVIDISVVVVFGKKELPGIPGPRYYE